jgi:glutaminase
MCPSFMATRDEKDTTRGRARALFEMLNGDVIEDGWRSQEVHEALDLYIRCCAIESDVDRLSAMAATLANGGVCPITERHVFSRQTVKHVLSLMLTCGMYDFSGEFAFQVGLPAKSGVSGALMIVVPGVAGFAVYSPRLGPKGNSVRGVEFSRRLVEAFPWHVYAPVMVDPDLGRSDSAKA